MEPQVTPNEPRFLQGIRDALDPEARFGAPPETAESYARLMAQASQDQAPQAPSPATRPGWRATAGIVLGVTAVLGIVASTRILGPEHTSAPDTHYRTQPGQRATIQLADGSTMLLAPSTTVTTNAAGIQVTGEAYFTVAPNTTRPVVVQTRTAVVRVLGTAFSVRQYPTDATSRIVVEEGKVTVHTRRDGSTARAPVVLAARMMAQVGDSGISVSTGIITRDFTSWTQGVLVFQGVALGEVVAELERAYGVDIRIADTMLAKQKIRLDVSVTDDSLAQILDLIGDVTNAHHTRTGNTYLLSPGRVGRQTAQPVPPRHLSPRPEQQYGR